MNDCCVTCGFHHSPDIDQMYDGVNKCIVTLQGKIGEAQAQLRWQMRENERLTFEVANMRAEHEAHTATP